MNITKNQYQELIEEVVDKTLRRDCRIERHGERMLIDFHTENGDVYIRNHGYFSKGNVQKSFKIIGHPLLIGDYMEKMEVILDKASTEYFHEIQGEIIKIWIELGASKSIQEVVEDSGWETKAYCGECGEVECACVTQKYTEEETLKSTAANALLSYLYNLFVK